MAEFSKWLSGLHYGWILGGLAVLLIGVGIAVVVAVFAAVKSYPEDYDAAGKLIEDMGLTVTAENRPEVQPGIRQKAKRERTEKQQFEQAVNRIYNVFCDYLHLLNHWAEEYAPRSPTEDFHPLFVEAMHKRDYVEYLLDLLLYGSREDKAFVVIEKGKEVDDLERRIREAKSGDGERAPGGDSGLTARDDDGRREGSSGNDGERSGEKLHHKRGNDPVL